MSSRSLATTQAEMSALADKHARVVVSYSGDKDSLVVLDIALRVFKEVTAFCMYFVPGLHFDQERMDFAKRRFGVDVKMYPHPAFLAAIQTASYCDVMPEMLTVPEIAQESLDRAVLADTGATLMLSGEKKSDGIFRRRKMATTAKTREYLVYPIKHWLRWEVLAYLKARDIPLPRQAQADNAGVSLGTKEVLYLHDNYPHDYEVMRSFFPYVEAIVVRRDLYGRTDG